jgi:hypothetical protein
MPGRVSKNLIHHSKKINQDFLESPSPFISVYLPILSMGKYEK